MTNQEAAEILKTQDCVDCTFGGYANNCKAVGCEIHQALDLAIKMLGGEKNDNIIRDCGEENE